MAARAVRSSGNPIVTAMRTSAAMPMATIGHLQVFEGEVRRAILKA